MGENYCYCVSYKGYGDEPYFHIEKVFYGDFAKEKAIDLAIELNIRYLEEGREITEDYGKEGIEILSDKTKSPDEVLSEYISSLDYSGGNYRYDDPFYDCDTVAITVD